MKKYRSLLFTLLLLLPFSVNASVKEVDGITTDYNIVHINHNFYQSENKAIQKVK